MVMIHGDDSWWWFMVMIHGDYSWWSPINIIEGLILSIRSSQVFDIAEAQDWHQHPILRAQAQGQRWVVHQNHILASPKESHITIVCG